MADNDKITRDQFAAKIKEKYPQYASVPNDRLTDMVLSKYPQYQENIMDLKTMPPGSASGPPTGVAAVKAGGYGALSKSADWIKHNFDLIGGALGGAAGLPAGPFGAAAGATLGGGAGRSLQQLAGFSEGKPKRSTGEAVEDIALGGLEQGAYELGGAGISKLGKAIIPSSRSAFLARGARAGEMGASKLDRLLPELDKTLKSRSPRELEVLKTLGKSGNPQNLENLEKLVNTTERNLNTEFSLALQPIASQPLAANAVSDTIRKEITENMKHTTEGVASQNYLKKRAMEFEGKTWTARELNQERELITKRLRAWHNAIASGQVAQAKVQANIAADTAAERALKDLLYDAADRSGTKPEGYFRALKQKQSDLISLQDYVAKNKEKVSKESLERSGSSLLEKVHLRGYAHPATGMPGGVLGASPAMFADPTKQSNKAIQKAFPNAWADAWRIVRTGAGRGLSREEANALAIRIMMSNDAKESPAP